MPVVVPGKSVPEKVLHVITALNLGGAEVMLHSLLSEMDRGRFEPVVVSLAGDGPVRERIEGLGVPVHGLGMRWGFPTPATVRRLIALCRRLKPDLMQGWMYHGNLAATLAAATSPGRVPLVWGIHHSLYDVRAEKVLTAALIRLGAPLSAYPRRIVYVSRISADQHEAIGYRKDRRVFIPNGFDHERLRPDPKAYVGVRAELGLGPNTPLVGSIARYHPMKDHANFLSAAGLLAERDGDTHFLLVGPGVDRSNEELNARISASGLGERVHLLGQRSDAPRLLAALDVASSSSAWGEAFPIVIGEAMACGVPCVVTDVGDSAWLVGDTGTVVPPRDPAALAEAWRGLLSAGQEARAALGRGARERVVEEFALPEIARRYEELYARLTGAAS